MMPKREALKQKLKAADRRRQRRQGDAQPPLRAAGPNDAARVDVVGLITETILTHVPADGRDTRDVTVVAALKSSLRGTTPSGDDAKRLAEELNQIPSKPGVSMRAFREAVQDLLSTASTHQDSRTGDAFLRYLSMLAEE